MIAHVCACTGWTWDYVAEEVDLVRLESLSLYYADHPTVAVMVAAYFGIKPEIKAGSIEAQEQDFSALFALGVPIEGPVI